MPNVQDTSLAEQPQVFDDGRVPSPPYPYREKRLELVTLPDGAVRNVYRGVSWKARLGQIIDDNVARREDPRISSAASYATRHNVRTGLFRLFTVLRAELGFKIENPARIEARHLQALWDWMERQWHAGELADSTIQGYCSYLRKFRGWIGQPKLIEYGKVAFKDPACGRRELMAHRDKSWEANNIDIAEIVDRAWDIEPWVAMALLAQAAFGLRRKESVCLRPASDYLDHGVLAITRGTKGGRVRNVFLMSRWQYEVLAILIEFCRRDGALKCYIGGTDRDLRANLRRYNYIVGEKLGITKDLVGTTGHGLRAGFGCRLLEAYGITAPVRGGDVSQAEEQTRERAYKLTAEAMGHSRTSIVEAYCGSVRMKGDAPHPDDVDVERIDPPNMEGLIEKLRQARRDLKRDEAQLRRFARIYKEAR